MRLETARDEFLSYKREGSQGRRPCAVTTLRTYRTTLQSFIDWMTVNLGQKATTLRFTTAVVRQYLDHRSGTRNLSGHTLSLDSTVLSELARWGSKKRYWRHEDVDDIPTIPKPETLPRPYHASERDAFLALELGDEDRVVRACLYFAGLRASEVIGLRIRDITPPHDLPTGETIPGRLYIWGKGSKERPVDIHAALWRELAHYLGTLPPGTKLDRRLLVKSDGEPWTAKMVLLHVKAWAKTAGVDGAKPHRWRHSFATDLVDSGADVLMVSQLMGHARVDTTAIYTRISDKRRAAAINMLPDYQPVRPTFRHDLTPEAGEPEITPENPGK